MITDAIKSKGKRQLSKIKRLALYFFRITKKKKPISALLIFAFCFLPFDFAQAQEAIGTSVLPESKVWFTLRDGIEYLEYGIRAGLDVDEFAPRLSFFFNAHNDVFEEVAKYRAARVLWAEAMRHKYGAKSEVK